MQGMEGVPECILNDTMMYRHESYYGNANEFYCDFSIFW